MRNNTRRVNGCRSTIELAGEPTSLSRRCLPESSFPPPGIPSDDRRDGRRVIDANLAKMDQKRSSAIMTLEAGLEVQGPIFYDKPQAGRPLKVGFKVSNVSEGHNLPTGSLGAQPQLWLNVVLIDPDGRRVWESGYLDRNADLADMHSVEVAKGRIPRDKDLFNLQTKFLINNVRGTDREAALPLNFSLDQLVFLRPGAVPISVSESPAADPHGSALDSAAGSPHSQVPNSCVGVSQAGCLSIERIGCVPQANRTTSCDRSTARRT